MRACGLDFGTSNSAVGFVRNGEPVLVPTEHDHTLIPSAVFFDYEKRGSVVFGKAAIDAYIDQREGRLMRALKSILGSPLIDETTALGYRKVPLTEVVELFIRHLKSKAETFAGSEISAVVHGRPVRFVDDDHDADAKAARVLESIARRAGFKEIVFEYEPIAAAFHYEETASREETVLIADIGGGTSDFTVIRIGPERRARTDRTGDILSWSGVRIGGTDFDTLLSLKAVMRELGLGTFLHGKNLPMPSALYFELATWSTINFTYTFRNETEVSALVADSQEPEKTARLLRTIRHRHGHRIALAVEDAKIQLSSDSTAAVPLPFLDPGLAVATSANSFEEAISDKTGRLHLTASQCIRDAGLAPGDLDTIFFTGGSSRVAAVRQAICRAAPTAKSSSGTDFLSVALGLTRRAERLFR